MSRSIMDYFTQLQGQNQAVEFLESAIKTSRLAPAYLFVGPSGIGKTLASNSFALAILMLNQSQEKFDSIKNRVIAENHPDILIVEPTYQHQGKLLTFKEASAANVKKKSLPQIRTEQIRQIYQFLQRPPLESSRSVVVIQAAQTMNETSANALLKTLEEPGLGIFILIANSLQSILPTLVSRCQYIPFSRLSNSQMCNVLQLKGHGEILQYEDILTMAQGSPGEAIESYSQFQSISIDLRIKLAQLPKAPLECLTLAQMIDQELEIDNQLWLVGYLQQKYWQKYNDQSIILALEKVRNYLVSYVQPRLVWENFYLKQCL
jgi:DNA polymerase-3 subunit delta'